MPLYFAIGREYRNHLQTMEQVHDDYIELRKAEVKTIVDLLIDEISFHQAEVEQRLKESIKDKVRMAVDTARAIHENEKLHCGDAEIKHLIIETLMSLRFYGGRGYYWIHDADHVLVAHPFRPASIGRNDSNLKPFQLRELTAKMRKVLD